MPTPVRGANTTMSSVGVGANGGGGVNFLGRGDAEDEQINELDMKEMRRQEYIREFFHKAESRYSHKIYKQAAEIFDVLKHDFEEDEAPTMMRGRISVKRQPSAAQPVRTPQLDFESENEKRLTFTLVYATLKYQRFLENMLEDCSFYRIYSEFKNDEALVMVILCDFQQRKFQRRSPRAGENADQFLNDIEDALFECRTKLNAGLARSRIKARVLSVDLLLPESVRHKDRIGSNMHLCCWVNQVKTDLNTVLDTLREEGFSMVSQDPKLLGKSYMLDHQCSDLITFPDDQREFLEEHPLVTTGQLVIQDKSSCVGPQSVRHLINEGDDILHINVGSGLTTAHLASLTHGTESTIYAFEEQTETEHQRALDTLEKYGVASRVKLINESLMNVEHTDERLRHIKVVLLTAQCSRSAVANPVNFICSEGEDLTILKSLSLGGQDDGKVSELVVKHNSLLKHVLRFPRVQGVVYYTRSMAELENEGVVTRAIEYVNMIQQKKTPFRICPPVIPLSDREIEHENPLNGKYLRYPPSHLMSGCFVATITREADDPKEAAKDILARAAARGLLTGVPTNMEEDHKKSGKKSGKKKETRQRFEPMGEKTSHWLYISEIDKLREYRMIMFLFLLESHYILLYCVVYTDIICQEGEIA